MNISRVVSSGRSLLDLATGLKLAVVSIPLLLLAHLAHLWSSWGEQHSATRLLE